MGVGGSCISIIMMLYGIYRQQIIGLSPNKKNIYLKYL
jgi:hypothetical protein